MLQSPDSVRPAVLGLEPYAPGLSIDEIRERYGLDRVIKLASNENPLGVSPLVREAIERHAGLAFRYAQSGTPRLARAVAARHGVDPARVVLGNGSDEVIDLLIRCRAEPGAHNVVTARPCFSLYTLQARLCGVELRECPLRGDFSYDWAGLRALADENTALVFVTTPDNPSGFCPPAAELEAFARSLPPGALLVLDEAYMDFADRPEDYSLLPRLEEFPNVAVLRTFSKCFGLAGLRLGYGIMPADLAACLCRARLPFSVNILAEAAGLAALADDDFIAASRKTVRLGREQLARGLRGLGCRVWPSHSNFLMFGPPESRRLEPEALFTALLEQGVIIRRLKSYGLPEMFRVSVGLAEENDFFMDCLKLILER
ncbi:MAG: histidinol-phosphate transaminase [Deltaproteobacteria bacterium]|jgi:histidinol-phosphate aminotransferase|nr:histidinol-phosphate transaminase [Deltaproteobacteria bacterium]